MTGRDSLPFGHRLPLRASHLIVVILAIALLLRVGVALYLGNSVSGLSGAHDEISYSMLGQRYAEGHGMTFPQPWYPWIGADSPQSYYSYTISLMLAGVYSVFGYQPLVARLMMAILSTLIVLMIYLVGRRFFNEQVALTAALIAALYAYLIFYGVTLVTETPFTLAILIAIYASFRIAEGGRTTWWFVLGLALATAILFRMAVVFFLPFLIIWLFMLLPTWRARSYVLIPVALIAVSVLPLTARNYRMWDRFLLLESQFGHVFWNGNHPDHDGDFHPFQVFPIPPEVLESKNDAIITNQLLQMGIANVIADPPHFIQLTVTRLREFFTFWPTAGSTREANLLRVLSFGILVPFAAIGLVANFKNWRRLSLVYLFIVIHTGVYAVSWTMIRYRIPIDVFLIMFAASALWLGVLLWQRRTHATRPHASADLPLEG